MKNALRDIEYPQLIFGGLTVVTLIVLLFAMSTSSVAFGVFNPFWEGAAELQDEADAVGAESTIARDTTQYGSVNATGTVAVVLSPDAPYTANQSRRVRQFVRGGGTLVVAEDFGPHGNRLLADVGASARFNGSLLRDDRYHYRSPAMPIVRTASNASLTQNVSNLTMNHATVLRPNGARVVAHSSSYSYLDVDRSGTISEGERLGSHPVITSEPVGDGRVITVADPSLFINVMLDRPMNKQFVRDLFEAHSVVLLDYSHATGLPPLALAVVIVRDAPVLQFGLGVLGLVALWGWFHRDLHQWLPGSEAPPEFENVSVEADAVIEALERAHPDWDSDSIRRVTEGVITRRSKRQQNE